MESKVPIINIHNMSLSEFPDHLIYRFVECMDANAIAIASCINRNFLDICRNVPQLPNATKFEKLMVVLKDTLLRPKEYWIQHLNINNNSNNKTNAATLHISMNDKYGRVKLLMTRCIKNKYPFYKLDAQHDTPQYELDSEQLKYFQNYLVREIDSITSLTIYTSEHFRGKRSSPIKTLKKRLECVFQDIDIDVIGHHYTLMF